MNLAGKVALISGGASGIGAATARKFVAEGAHVAIGDIDAERGAALAETLGPAAQFVMLDVTAENSWRQACETVHARFGSFTTLVQSAGVSHIANIEDETLAGFRQTMAINLEGAFLGCKIGVENLKHMPGAAIVNVASTLGVKASAAYPAYCSSKGGVRMLTRATALHCAENNYDLRVNAILSGPIHTEMVERQLERSTNTAAAREAMLARIANSLPLKRLGRPSEPANVIAFLASDEASFITGADFPVDGGGLA